MAVGMACLHIGVCQVSWKVQGSAASFRESWRVYSTIVLRAMWRVCEMSCLLFGLCWVAINVMPDFWKFDSGHEAISDIFAMVFFHAAAAPGLW